MAKKCNTKTYSLELCGCRVFVYCSDGEIRIYDKVTSVTSDSVSFGSFKVPLNFVTNAEFPDGETFLELYKISCCGELDVEKFGTTNIEVCNLSTGEKCTLLACYDEGVWTYYDPLTAESVDISAYGKCTEEVEKPALYSWFSELTDDSKYTFTPDTNVDNVQVAIYDSKLCHYVRVTLICPDGTVGCTLLTPFQPQKVISLKDFYEVTEICVEVVQKSNDPIKDWVAITPEAPIEINVDGLNK